MLDYEKIAKVFDDFAKIERKNGPEQLIRARQHHPHLITSCEGCGNELLVSGGLCPQCWELAAGACRFRAIDLRKRK